MLWFAAAAFCSFHHGEVESLPNVYFPAPSPLLPAIALATASLLRLKTTHLATFNIRIKNCSFLLRLAVAFFAKP